MGNEIWKSVFGYENLYEISNSGTLRSIRIKNGIPKYKIIKGSISKDNSINHTLIKNNIRTTKYIHRLVAETFINRTDINSNIVYHLDKNKQNNHVSNLAWENKTKYCKTCGECNKIIQFSLINQCSYCYDVEYRKKHYSKPRILNPICEGCKKSRTEVIMQTAKLCRSCYNKEYRKKNLKKEMLRCANYYNNNRNHCAERHKKYRNRPEISARIKQKKDEWRKENRDRELQKSREYKSRKEYRQKINRERNEKYKNDIQYNLNARVRTALNQCLKGKNGQKSEKLLGYSRKTLLIHLETTMKDKMSWDNYLSGKIHVDHVVPITAFEINSFVSETFKLCWDLKNLRLEWGDKNLIKNDILPNGFRARDLIYKIKNQDDYDRVLNGGFPLADLTNYNCEI